MNPTIITAVLERILSEKYGCEVKLTLKEENNGKGTKNTDERVSV